MGLPGRGEPPPYELTLYVRGASPRSTSAIQSVRTMCDELLAGRFVLTVVDGVEHPERLVEDHIVALPTLVKHAPPPVRHLVGDLTDLDALRSGLDLSPAGGGG
jgi:circadian clock protein KaiB